MRVFPLTVGPLQACCYLIADDQAQDAAIIDPGGDAELIVSQVRYRRLLPRLLLLTHGHIDHVGAAAAVKRAFPDAPLCIGGADAPMLADAGAALADLIGLPFEPCPPDRLLADGERLALGSDTLEVIATPGHTPGGVCFLVRPEGDWLLFRSGKRCLSPYDRNKGTGAPSEDERGASPQGKPCTLFSGDCLFAGGIGRTDFPGGSPVGLLDSIQQRLFALPDDTLVYPGHGDPTTIGEERRTNPFLR